MSEAEILDFSSGQGQAVPPHIIEAEEQVLGGLMFDANAILAVLEVFESPAVFYLSPHQQIFSAILVLHRRAEPFDLTSLSIYLSSHGLLSRIGGQSKLAQLQDRSVSTINIDYLARKLWEKYLSRELTKVGEEMAQLGYKETQPIDERIDMAEKMIFDLKRGSEKKGSLESLDEISVPVFHELQEISETQQSPAIATGFYDLDELLAGGLYPGDLVIIGGRPSMGKSLLGHALAYQIAKRYNQYTVIFSLEMDKRSIYQRYLSAASGVEGNKLRQGNLNQSDWDKAYGVFDEVNSTRVLVDDSACPSIHEIRSKVRSATLRYGDLKLVVIDYLQLLVGGEGINLAQKIGEVTRQLKLLAKECNVPVVLLSQLNRAVEDRNNKRPLQSDLRDSGRIEEDADVILFPYRDEYYNPDTQDVNLMEISITKHRNGATGMVKLIFDGAYSRLLNRAK